MKQQVVQAEFKLGPYLELLGKANPNSSAVTKVRKTLAHNPAVVAACTSTSFKLDRQWWLTRGREIVGADVTDQVLREEIISDLIAIDEQSLNVYGAEPDGQA